MKRAIVLSGGGSRGAYQIGFWKAIRELGIDYDIVTGTSIGSLNGAFMVQGNYKDAVKLWSNMNYDKVLEDGIDGTFSTPSGRKKIISKYAKGALKGGLSVPALEKTIKDNFKPELFFSSPVDYGLMTARFPSLKPVAITKDKLTKENFPDYLLASAACFPAFKLKNIDDKNYIDGGYYDNLPINLATQLGATEVIAVYLKAVGRVKKKINPNVPVTLIAPRNDIGNFLVLESKQAKRAMKFGYNDTMKTFKMLERDKYTFKRGSLKRNFIRQSERFINLLQDYFKVYETKEKYKCFFKANKVEALSRVLEKTAHAFNVDEVSVYRTSVLNVLIKKAYRKTSLSSANMIKSLIKNNKIKDVLVSKELICYLYEEINKKQKPCKSLERLAILFPDGFLCALYLKTIMR